MALALALSHEMRNALAGVLGALDLLEEHGVQPELVQTAIRRARYASDLSCTMLDISKPQPSAAECNYSLSGLIKFVQEACLGLYPSEPINLEFDLGTDVVCRGREVYLRQVLINIVSNALKFTLLRHQSGGGVVRVRAWHADGVLHASVTDNGPGMCAETQARLFGAFEQAPETASSGTGLGLWISKMRVTQMHGSIAVESEVGVGSTFHIDVPAIIVVAQPEIKAPVISGKPRLSARPRILVVDDDVSIARVVEIMLARIESEHELAMTCAGALDLMRRLQFDLMVVDSRLPDGTGLSLVQNFRAICGEQGRRVGIIGFSGGGETADFLRGVDEFVPKPTTPANFQAAVGRCCKLVGLAAAA